MLTVQKKKLCSKLTYLQSLTTCDSKQLVKTKESLLECTFELSSLQREMYEHALAVLYYISLTNQSVMDQLQMKYDKLANHGSQGHFSNQF